MVEICDQSEFLAISVFSINNYKLQSILLML